MESSDEIREQFTAIVEEAYRISVDVGREVEEILRKGREQPLGREEAEHLLGLVITTLRDGAQRRGDRATAAALRGPMEQLVAKVMRTRETLVGNGSPRDSATRRLELVSRNGIQPGPVFPHPSFHGIEIPMRFGFVRLTDIGLWDGNERLEIHLGQFRQVNGRPPTPQELLDIMLSKMTLPGIPQEERDDQFEIVQLARSIAVNGVRKPPILDIDGTLLDGNRRVAACHYILNSEEFETEQKRKVEYVFAWQLTEHATDDQRSAVVVSLNFEPDCKQDWPEYVKAKKVYEEWQGMLALEPRAPGAQRQAQLKRELSKKFALGPDTAVVSRYIKMVDWANDFEEFEVHQRGCDEFEVKHRANRYFQYFDELGKGTRPGGVAYHLDQDDNFKQVVFDLLYDGKFVNWRQIRGLKHVHQVDEAHELLKKARAEPDVERAQEMVENAITIARSRSAEERELGANTRIEAFVSWLEELPVRAFRDRITPKNLERLLRALRLVERQVKVVLGTEEAGT